MRTLKELPYPHNTNYSKFKSGTIQNEDDINPGTPVVEEVYGDVLTNLYKVLELADVAPNQNQDSETSGFQIVEALKNLANELNDIERLLNLNGNTWSTNIKLEILPDKYFIFARASSDYVSGTNYTFKGVSGLEYNLSSTGIFKTGDELLLILDKTEVRVYPLSNGNTPGDEVFTVFGNPLPFNDTNNLYYESDGKLLTDKPTINNLQNTIRVSSGDGTLLNLDILVLKGSVICLVFRPSDQQYLFYQFNLSNLSTPVEVSIIGFTIPATQDNRPYLFTDGDFLYFTNNSNRSENDNEIDKLNYDSNTIEISFIQSITLDNLYRKTTNTIIKNDRLVTFVDGRLTRYNLTTSISEDLGQYNGMNGILFCFNNQSYFTTGEVAKKWDVLN